MKTAQKLDALQEIARQHAKDTHKLYVIGLLAEHAEEDEITEEVLEWITGIFKGR